jgi:hypothetical protein
VTAAIDASGELRRGGRLHEIRERALDLHTLSFPEDGSPGSSFFSSSFELDE